MKYFVIWFCLFCVLFSSCKTNEENSSYKIEQTKSGGFDSIKLFGKNNLIILEINFNDNGTISAYTIKDSTGFRSDVNLDENGIAYHVSYGNNLSSSGNYNNGTFSSYAIEDSSGFLLAFNLKENRIVSYKISDGNNYENITNYNGYDGIIFERYEQVNEITEYLETIYENGLVKKEKMTENN